MFPVQFPPFEPHPFIRGGHAQTVVGAYLPARLRLPRTATHPVRLDDGDVVVLHDDRPATWKSGDRTVLLMHGLAGSARSPYMVRIAAKLGAIGIRTFRMDHRGCGAGEGLARLPYNAGRSEDALTALHAIGSICPGSPTAIVGFSLSGNIVLKLLGEDPDRVPAQLERAMAVNPAIDLHASVECIRSPRCRLYDLNFVHHLYRQVRRLHRQLESPPQHRLQRKPREIVEFDELYTAAVCGYQGAADYYTRCSAAQFVHNIQVPTLVLTSRDDPLVPIHVFERALWSTAVSLHVAESGGHLGYVARPGTDPDRRWMDWRVLDWMQAAHKEDSGHVISSCEELVKLDEGRHHNVSELPTR